ncbi:MAG: 16S rRNA (cytosine(1402)-N(4))-methyltransferase RsmH [Flavobacteriales bacterium]|nr:16S rRNA (cytosine(1402)-N(4))-methyltransferase RsmH [Flavobacteriales bacterium]
MEQTYHNPVLLNESIQHLIHNPDGIYVDCTFGGGGHSKAILEKLSNKGKLFAFDQDDDAQKNTLDDSRFTLINQNFRYIEKYLRFYGINKIDGILADLGVSSHQFDVGHRGFSTRFDGELDMRMNINQALSAKEVINEYSEEQLADILYYYGELKSARRMAREITEERVQNKITSTSQLKEIFDYLPKSKSNKILAQLFQAVRIEVNQELEALKELLTQSKNIIHTNGTLVMISYHSLEDRLVKKFLKTGLFQGEPEKDVFGNWEKPFVAKPSKTIIPSNEEISENPRARSAKMRVGIKL